jgi:hypothetical protein
MFDKKNSTNIRHSKTDNIHGHTEMAYDMDKVVNEEQIFDRAGCQVL